jgi:hypothetical protein
VGTRLELRPLATRTWPNYNRPMPDIAEMADIPRRLDAYRTHAMHDNDGIISNDKIRPGLPGLSQLAHQTIQLPLSDEGIDLGPITLGDRIGRPGHYGFLYAIVGHRHAALKLIHLARSGPPSIARQVSGYRLIEAFPAEIPAVKIIASHFGSDQEASYLIVENLYDGRWANRDVVVAPSALGERERAATRRLYDNLAERNFVAVDCHKDNLFFFSGDTGDLMAGILDHDYIFNMKDIATLPQRTVKRLFVLAGPAGGSAWSALDRALKGPRISAKEFMEVFYQTKIAV